MPPKADKAKASQKQCRRHNGEPVTVYSTKYEKCMCLKCAMEQHDLLTDFMPISEGVQMMKSVGKVLSDEITVLSETSKAMKNDRTKFMEKIHASDRSIKAEMRKLRDKINRHLDVIEQKLGNKLKILVEKCEKSFLKDQHEMQMIETDLKKIKSQVDLCLKSEVDTALISGIAEEKQALQEKKHQVRTLQEKMPTQTLLFRPSDAILDFVENVPEFGDVSMQFPFEESDGFNDSFQSSVVHSQSQIRSFPGADTPLSFKHHSSPRSVVSKYPNSKAKNKYGMHNPNPYHSLNARFGQKENGDLGFRNEQGIEIADKFDEFEGIRDDPVILGSDHTGPCDLAGVAALGAGRIVVCDSKHKCIQLINRKSEILDELVFHDKPCGIDTVSDNSVVVSFIEKDFISVFAVSNRALSHRRDISVSGRGGSYSVAFSKDKFAVCRRGEIRIISSDDGSLIRRIQIEAHFPQIAMSDGGSKIYLSDYVGGKVICMNELGKSRWEYSQEELEPCSLAVDLNQLFIADVKGRILIMSTYGVLVRELPCYGRLHALGVDKNTGTLLVTLEDNKDKTKSRSIKIIAL